MQAQDEEYKRIKKAISTKLLALRFALRFGNSFDKEKYIGDFREFKEQIQHAK